MSSLVKEYANNNTDIANMFNDYFVSILSSDSGVVYKQSDHEHNIEFEIVTVMEEEVLANIMNLGKNKARAPDNISARLQKETVVQIAPSLCSLFNKFLCIGVVPDEWKLANVVLVYKHGDKAEAGIYRPVSLLPLISKTHHHHQECHRDPSLVCYRSSMRIIFPQP